MYKTAIKLALSNKYNVVITFPNYEVFKGFNRLFKTIYLLFITMIILILLNYINRKKITDINTLLKIEAQKLRTVLNSSPNIVLIKDLQGIYIDCNARILELKGLEPKDIIGKTDYDLFCEDEVKEILENDKIVVETKCKLVKESYYLDTKGDKIYFEKHIIPLLDDNKNIYGLLIIGFDVTHQKKQQELLEQAKENAEKVSAIKSNFLANMSHEIRTPLNGVIGFAQLLKGTNLNEEQKEFISDIEKSSEVLLNIINDILDFSKIEANKLKIDNISFDIRSLVEDITLINTTNAARKNLEINSLICSDVPQRLFGDPGRIKQIFNNLVSNAIKFTHNGEIVIYVKLLSENNNSCCLTFEVKDTGIGIPADKLEMIFDEFAQADTSTTRKYGGTGLGLAISQKLVSLMGGYMEVESTVNEGSKFIFTLPFVCDESHNKDICNYIEALNGTKILLLSNDTTDSKIIHYYLNEVNCIIHEAKSFNEAIDIFNRENKNISAIIVDYNFKNEELGEFEILLHNINVFENIPLILYTSLANRGDSLLLREKGFKGYLTKPIKKIELLETISMVINDKYREQKDGIVTKYVVKENKFDSKNRILIVEDTELNAKFLNKLLNKEGLSCDVAYNGQEAIKAFKSKNYDLILMDCQMPILDGYKATMKIRKIEAETNADKKVPIIAMTANALSTDADKCLKAGMDEYLTKPVKINEFWQVIGKYLEVISNNEVNRIETVETAEPVVEFYDINAIVNELITEVGFSKNEVIEFLVEYTKTAIKIIEAMHSNIKDNNLDELKLNAHKLKGMSSNLRVEMITQVTKELEIATLNNNSELCLELINKINLMVSELDKAVNEFIYI